jgi:hypothetical protein
MLKGEPASVVFDEDYWLSHCEGFEVRALERRVGIVREVHFRTRLDRPDELVVSGGVFGNRERVVPVGEVVEIVPREERIIVESVEQKVPNRALRLLLRRA